MTVADGEESDPERGRGQLRRATIKDVAQAAGVSQSTAARALSGEGYVAEAVQARVLAAADELGYVPHAMASSLRRQSSRSIGVLVSDLRNAFYADLAAGVGRRAREHGYTMVLVDDRGSTEEEREALAVFVGMRVAGVILTPLSSGAIDYLTRQRTPFIQADRTFSSGASDAVVIDNVGASRRMADHLISLGHRRIALFIDETDWTTGADRFRGYQESMAQSSVEVDQSLIIPSGWDAGGSRRAAVEALSRRDRPTAVFAANNIIAEGVWRGITDLGLRVPDDVSLVAFDDAPWMSMVTPGVTAVAQDTVALGAAAMDLMLDRIRQPEAPARTVVLPAEMLPRGSTLAPIAVRR